MTTFSIVEDASVAASGVSAAVISAVKSGIFAAAELWNRYFDQGGFDIEIKLSFADIAGSTLATGGSSLHFFGADGPGQEIWMVNSMEEFKTGAEFDPGGDTTDITLTIDTPILLSGGFFFDPDPFSRTAAIPFDKSDFISVMLHELGHGFGFLGSVSGEPSAIDDPGPDITPFDDNVDLIGGERFWVGPKATAIIGGAFKLDPGSLSHIAFAGDGGFDNLMDPSLLDGTRDFILPVHVAMLDDMGMPIRSPTAGADVLFGFEFVDDVISSLAGDDTLMGLGGDDSLFAGFGDDRADGGSGNDFIRTGPGRDTLLGGDGNDTLGASNKGDLLRGEGGADLMLGSNGNDRLFGGDGDDTMLGGNGRDTLTGDAGADRLNGGNQIDWASYDAAGAGVAASLATGTGSAGEALGDVFIAIENLEGSAFADTLTGSGGANRLDGGAGADLLSGLGGADILAGETGNDTLTGGAGDDKFWYRKGGDADRIADFTPGAGSDDAIRLFNFGAAFDTFAEVIAAGSQVGADTVIDFGGGDTITLAGITLATLHADDFLFG